MKYHLLFLLGALTGCSPTSDDATGAAAPVDADAPELLCGPAWTPFDAVHRCTQPPVPAAGLCVSATTHVKGVYSMCAVSPDGQVFVGTVAGDAIVRGDGWTFAPDNVVVMRLGLPAPTGAAASTCDEALSMAVPVVPACSNRSDASPGDGSSR